MPRSAEKVVGLLRYYSEANRPLSDLSVLIGRTRETLRRHAKRAGLSFPDYQPRQSFLEQGDGQQ